MKIVAIVHYYIEENRAGGETFLHQLLKTLVEAGHDVTCLITDTNKRNTTIDGVKVVYNANKNDLYKYESDVILTHFQNGPVAFEYCIETKKPLIYIVHNDKLETIRQARKISNGLIVINTEWISKKIYTPAKRVIVNPATFVETPEKDENGYTTLVNLTRAKGADLFYYLAVNNPHRKFLAVKGGYAKKNQKRMDLPNIKTIEMTSNIQKDVYAKSRIVLMPSNYETYGMVAAEAMANGIPVIVNDTPGLKENCKDAAIYANIINRFQWRAAINRLDDKETYEKYSKLGIERNKQKNPKEQLDNFIKAVESL